MLENKLVLGRQCGLGSELSEQTLPEKGGKGSGTRVCAARAGGVLQHRHNTVMRDTAGKKWGARCLLLLLRLHATLTIYDSHYPET